MKDASVMTPERAAQIKARPIDYSDIPKMSKEELCKRTGRFPNISQEKLEGIRALVNRQGIEKITRENLSLAKQRWKEAEEAYERAQQDTAQL